MAETTFEIPYNKFNGHEEQGTTFLDRNMISVEDSPSVTQDMATIGASNVSHQRNQLAVLSTGKTEKQHITTSTNLPLQSIFSHPNQNDDTLKCPKVAKSKEDTFEQNEYFYDEFEGCSASGSLAGSSLEDGIRVPADSLNQGDPFCDINKGSSTLVVVSRETPRAFCPAGSAKDQNSLFDVEPASLSTPYSSDTSTGDEKNPQSHVSSPKRQQTVLYSAIGSLEDPSNGSFKWKHRNQIHKYEFPSGFLLPPRSTKKDPVSSRDTDGAIKVLDAQPKANLSHLQTLSVIAPSELKPDIEKASLLEPLPTAIGKKPSTLKTQREDGENASKKVRIASQPNSSSKRKSKKPIEMFRPSSDAYTPRMGKREIKYKPAEMRTPVQKMANGLGTLSRPNFRDALRRVAMIIHQHIVKIERRFEAKAQSCGVGRSRGRADKLFMPSMKEEFSEDRFITPTYKCTMVRVPMARVGVVYGLKQVKRLYEIPSEGEIYDFAHRLFKTVQLSSECSIVCLIYVERLMEEGKVPLLASTWRPIVMTGLLLASKVWQDLSSWNIEFTNVYPQYSLEAIHRLEIKFLRILKWDLYVSSSLYAKYYFALRALVEKTDFRQRYNRMVGGVDSVQVQEALKVEERSTLLKEEALSQLSRSM